MYYADIPIVRRIVRPESIIYVCIKREDEQKNLTAYANKQSDYCKILVDNKSAILYKILINSA